MLSLSAAPYKRNLITAHFTQVEACMSLDRRDFCFLDSPTPFPALTTRDMSRSGDNPARTSRKSDSGQFELT